MKLRLHHHAVRLRLSQSEVTQFTQTGEVAMHLPIAPGQVLNYCLRQDATAQHLHATYEGNAFVVHVPAAQAQQWADTDQVGLEATQSNGSAEGLHLLIEKDFKCLHREGRPQEDHDTFPNPHAEALSAKNC